jgi:hypothetical protein
VLKYVSTTVSSSPYTRKLTPLVLDPLHRELVVVADGDQPAGPDERVDLGLVEGGRLLVVAGGVAGQEQMRLVLVELGTLVRLQHVLDGQFVQAQLDGQLIDLLLGRAAQVEPHHGVVAFEVLGDVGDREALPVQDPLAVHPRAVHSCAIAGDSRRSRTAVAMTDRGTMAPVSHRSE